MVKVTAIRTLRSRRKRVNVLLDGKGTVSLEAEVALKANLRVGQELSDDQIEALARSDRFQRCLNAAAHYLGYRPRSEAELRQRLRQHGFDDNSLAAVLKLLKEQGLIDDVAFAQFWSDSRKSFSPRSRWLTGLELRQKGVAEDIIANIVDTVDDDDSAYRAAVSRLRRLPRTDFQSFRQRLGDYLRRRGFSYGVIDHTVRRVWEEQSR